MATVTKEQEAQLKSKYDDVTLIQDWLRMIHEQVVLIRLGVTDGRGEQTLIGGIDVLQFLVGDFWETAVSDVEKAAQDLANNGFGKYAGVEA